MHANDFKQLHEDELFRLESKFIRLLHGQVFEHKKAFFEVAFKN
jgi:hypothetical protein